MHHIEPFYGWMDLYRSESDRRSPFYGREYSEFEFTNQIYNYVIHPQWDGFGSSTLLLKVLYAHYKKGFAIIELIGEWNDCLHNDIMTLKRDVIDEMISHGIHRFILIGENVLNFHPSDDSYYEEWSDDVYDGSGWICLINFREHVIDEFKDTGIDNYVAFGGEFDHLNWRTYQPIQLFKKIDALFQRRLEY